ncbi:DUF3114 domain-containing protein [Liquorilactobacillus oeni]|uniref:DUF3114 domain-containing protein n=1 Tax=Liquorilactobacillus oeni DSM 19972 TaxID=1423777 RepID=A0A0R1MKE5_9LACO|nr:DUF3114 domain-containing protein [Liquorilactobacillus oeni]KRL05794.1 hypothetical protein FD46_GL000550 [Liquorilactobacillus oeni DSM 19972]
MQDKNFTDIAALKNELLCAGWDEVACKVYIKSIRKQSISFTGHTTAITKNSFDKMCYLIGSELYTRMFKAAHFSPLQKLSLILNQLNAKIDVNGFLQISGEYRLDPAMPPHAYFLKYFRKLVQRAFLQKSLKDYVQNNGQTAKTAMKVHLLRSYIDKNNIEFVQQNFIGKNDFEKLLQYAKQAKIKLDYSTAANYHNRYLTNNRFFYPQNMKVQVTKSSRMSEFIVDLKDGHFVSEWQVYKYNTDGTVDSDPRHYNLQQSGEIANTESFNYGIPHGRYPSIFFCDNHSHYRLDVWHPVDPLIRNTITNRKNTYYWKTEKSYYWKTEKSYYVKDKEANYAGNYADVVKNGKRDYEAWRQVPDSKKAAVYLDFLEYCRRRLPLQNPGFAKYVKRIGN